MNVDLKELGITFIVGAFTILGLEAILYHYFRIQLTGFFHNKLRPKRMKAGKIAKGNEVMATNQQDDEESTSQSMRAMVFIGLAFAIGLLAEDLSYKYVDNVQTPFKALPAWINSRLSDELNKKLSLPSKESSRIRTLINNFETDKPEVQPLALDLANNKAFAEVYADGKKFDDWILRINQCRVTKSKQCADAKIPESKCTWYDKTCPLFDENVSREDVKEAIYGLYYHAKNEVYINQNYYDEMRRIETRRDFARSIALIAYIYLVGALFLGAGRAIYILIKYKTSRHKVNQRREIYRTVIPVWLILFSIYFFGMWAYERESDEFNKRAFGYYRSGLVRGKNKTNITDQSGATAAPNAQINPTPNPTPQ